MNIPSLILAAACGVSGIPSAFAGTTALQITPGAYVADYNVSTASQFLGRFRGLSNLSVPTNTTISITDPALGTLFTSFQVAADSTVTLLTGQNSVTTSPGEIIFDNVTIRIDPQGYQDSYFATFNKGGVRDVVFIPNTDMFISNSETGAVITTFDADAAGNIALKTGQNSVTTGPGEITFDNVTIHVNPQGFLGSYFATFNKGGARDVVYVPNVLSSISDSVTGATIALFTVDAAGNISLQAGQNSVTTGPSLITFDNVTIQIDPQGWLGTYSATFNFSGPRTVVFVPNVLSEIYDAGTGSLIALFSADAAGNISLQAGQVSITTAVSLIQFKNIKIHVDPGQYTGIYALDFQRKGPQDIIVVPGVTLAVSNGGGTTLFLFSAGQAGITINGVTSNPNAVTTIIGGQSFVFTLSLAPTDTTTPVVTVLSPRDGSFVRGTIPVTASATDSDQGDTVVSIECFAGTQSLGVQNGASYSTTLNTAAVADGSLAIRCAATDMHGKVGVASVAITVDNTPPTVTIVAPTSGSVVSGTIVLQASASDANLATLSCTINNQSVGTVTATGTGASLSASFDTLTLLDGALAIACTATDKAGNVGSATNTVTVHNDSIIVNPTTLNLSAKGRWITVYVLGPNISLFLPIGALDLGLAVPGSALVPVDTGFAGSTTIGSFNGQPALTLKFDRQAVEAAIRAGIASGAINPSQPVPLTLTSGTRPLDNAMILVKP